MYKWSRLLILLFFVHFSFVYECLAETNTGNEFLANINNQKYFRDDFKHWWLSWKEKDGSPGESLDSFVDWHLMAQEAEKMELFNNPNFRHKISVFLKSRTLLLYKRDIIDNNIQISESDIRGYYNNEYTPSLHLAVLSFKDKMSAQNIIKDFQESALSLESILETGKAKGIAIDLHEKWYRPIDIPEEWRTQFKERKDLTLMDLGPSSSVYLLAYIIESKNADDNDFNSKKKSIRDRMIKSKEKELTLELVTQLKEKYNVRIDDTLFNKIDLLESNEDLLGQTLVYSDKMSVTAGNFLAQFEKYLKKNFNKNKLPAELKKSMRFVLNSMIVNSLISWESAGQQYEQNEPFVWTYQFYWQNRLIKELESLFLKGAENISGEEMLNYYQENINDFLVPEEMKFILVQGDPGEIRKIWLKTISGAKLSDVMSESLLKPVSKTEKSSDLDIELAEILRNLSINELSKPFPYREGSTLVKLLTISHPDKLSFEKVETQIADKLLKDKKTQAKQQYIKRLREKSTVEINKSVWGKVISDLSS